MKQVTPYYTNLKNIIQESIYPCDGWKNLLNAHLEVIYAIENCNYTMFEDNFSVAEYFLYSSPEIYEFEEKDRDKLAQFNLNETPVDGSVYIRIPNEVISRYPDFLKVHIENYFNYSIFFKLFEESKSVEINTLEWEFFKKVKNLIKDTCLEKFKEDFNLDNIESLFHIFKFKFSFASSRDANLINESSI